MMITDRTRIKRSDPVHPENCVIVQMHRLLLSRPRRRIDLDDDCRNAASLV